MTSIQGAEPEITEAQVVTYFAEQVADAIEGDRERGEESPDSALLEAAGADDIDPSLQRKVLAEAFALAGPDPDPYSPFTGPDSYDRNGAWDGFNVTSDADPGL